MGLLLKPKEIKRQTKSIIQIKKIEIDSLKNALQNISEFIANPTLSSAVGEGIKQQLVDYELLIQGMICANETIILDSLFLAATVGDEELVEAEIIAEITKLRQQIKLSQTKIDSYLQNKKNLLNQSFVPFLMQYYDNQIAVYQLLVSANEKSLKELERKLKRLREIEATAQSLYQTANILFDTIRQGVADIAKSGTSHKKSLSTNESWRHIIKKQWKNSETKICQELVKEGWDGSAIHAYQKYLSQEMERLTVEKRARRIKEIYKETYQIGSKVYGLMFDACQLSEKMKLTLILDQMKATIDKNGFLQLSGKYQFHPNMPPHDSFLKKFSKCIRGAFPKNSLKDEGELGRRIHLFRSYLDQHNIEYIRSQFEGATDYDKLKTYAEKYQVELDYSTGANFHNRTIGSFDYPRNTKVLVPKRYENGGGRMGEFIIALSTGEFVSQWSGYRKRADGSYESDPSKYRPVEKYGNIANTESFNYGPSKGKNRDTPLNDHNSHRRLDIEHPRDTEIRESMLRKWKSPKDFNKKDKDGVLGKYADIVKVGEVDYQAWREVPENKKQAVYDDFVAYCRKKNHRNPGFAAYMRDKNR